MNVIMSLKYNVKVDPYKQRINQTQITNTKPQTSIFSKLKTS